MFCFVMALKSKALSKDWGRVCRLFEASLMSAYRQTDPDFRIIVVCHETPSVVQKYDHRVEYINVDFPPPEQMTTPLCMKDKWTKIHLGMIRAGEHRPDFVMLMDADDLVSNRLVAHAHAHKQSNGWRIRLGYDYAFGSRWLHSNNKFNCGTNAIVSARLIHFPKEVSPESREKCVVLRYGHTAIEEQLAKMGTPLEVLPFHGAVYVHSHGDNDSHIGGKLFNNLRFLVREMPNMRYATAARRREFAMDMLPSD